MPRVAWTLFLLAALAGCAHHPPPQASTFHQVVPTRELHLKVTTDELLPIPNATVLVDNGTVRHMTDENGRVVISNITKGGHNVRAWAPIFFRNEKNLTISRDGWTNESIILARRPPDYIYHNVNLTSGACFLAAEPPAGPDPGCVPSPVPVPPPPTSFSVKIPNGTRGQEVRVFHHLDVYLSWNTSAPADVAFEVTLEPNGTFGDGGAKILLPGPSPIHFRLNATDVDPAVVDNGHSLVFRPGPPSESQSHAVVAVTFEASFDVAVLYASPPNPPWD